MTGHGAFCGKCGTFTIVVKGRRNRLCPRCHPEKVPPKDTRPSNKTGKPCDDRGICKPEECIKALDCDDGRRHRRKGTT
jgi:hypothetical protein